MSDHINPALRRAQLQAVLSLQEANTLLRDVQGGRGKPPAERVALFVQTTAVYYLADQVAELADAMNAIAAKLEGGRHG